MMDMSLRAPLTLKREHISVIAKRVARLEREYDAAALKQRRARQKLEMLHLNWSESFETAGAKDQLRFAAKLHLLAKKSLEAVRAFQSVGYRLRIARQDYTEALTRAGFKPLREDPEVE